MKRQIKFRVWDNHGKIFRRANIEGSKNSAWGITINRGIFSLESTEGLTYQQFTGLFDSQGKEIYEGDIYNLETHCVNPYYCVFFDGCYWNKRCGQTQEDFLKTHVNVHPTMTHDLRSSHKAAKIIGNIFENPELLSTV
jgi:uncharacterized phage protein (TIGR01671 family)